MPWPRNMRSSILSQWSSMTKKVKFNQIVVWLPSITIRYKSLLKAKVFNLFWPQSVSEGIKISLNHDHFHLQMRESKLSHARKNCASWRNEPWLDNRDVTQYQTKPKAKKSIFFIHINTLDLSEFVFQSILDSII